jgi:hypothetical protein
MSPKIFALTLGLVLCLSVFAMANGNFWGYVAYCGPNDACAWTEGDQVRIDNIDTGQSYYYDITREYNGFRYGSAPLPPGHYHIVVSKWQDPGCDGPAVIQEVNHGTSNQQVNLIILCDSGDPERPQNP